jgi:hypothetical protein
MCFPCYTYFATTIVEYIETIFKRFGEPAVL